MDLPTYTNIWRIEKRLYKLYDFRLPMPLPVGQIAVFLAFAVPYILVLSLIGLPFSHTLLWVYVLPPGVLAWLTTRPVLEGKRLPELIMSQTRYLLEPRTWCRMAPFAEKNEIVIVCRVWRRAEREPAVEVAVAMSIVGDGAEGTSGRRMARPLSLTTRPVRGRPARGRLVGDGAAAGGPAVGGAALGSAALGSGAEALVEGRSGRGPSRPRSSEQRSGEQRLSDRSSGDRSSGERGSDRRSRSGGRAGRVAARERAAGEGRTAGRRVGSGGVAPEPSMPSRPPTLVGRPGRRSTRSRRSAPTPVAAYGGSPRGT